MNIARIQTEFKQAQQYFSIIELHPTPEGNVFVKVALQPSSQYYIIAIYFPETYPNEMPKVYISKPQIEGYSPHRYNNGNICYMHPTMWNPGVHNILFVIQRAAKWLGKYEIWKRQGKWPGAEIKH